MSSRRKSPRNSMSSCGFAGRRGASQEKEAVDYEEEDERRRSEDLQREVDSSEPTPAGRYRGSVTDDPEFVWRVPAARFLVRSTGEAAKPDTSGQAQTVKALVEALGHFGIEWKASGRSVAPTSPATRSGSRPGMKMSKVANLKDDLAYALAATESASSRRSRKTAVGVEIPTRVAGSCTSATSTRSRPPTGRR